jgi:hypothetical protein
VLCYGHHRKPVRWALPPSSADPGAVVLDLRSLGSEFGLPAALGEDLDGEKAWAVASVEAGISPCPFLLLLLLLVFLLLLPLFFYGTGF